MQAKPVRPSSNLPWQVDDHEIFFFFFFLLGTLETLSTDLF